MTENKRPLILVTNDDGIDAPGIHFLAQMASLHGEVVMVAPLEAMSGMSHAITVRKPLRYRMVTHNGEFEQYVVEGTPVDCVKTAIRQILDRKPDLLLSGVNHGSNASVNVIYSGTMAAVLEGAMAGIPSIGFSLLDYHHSAPLAHLDSCMSSIISETIRNGLPSGVCLNVNIPSVDPEKGIAGVKLCRQANGYWLEKFEKRLDPHGEPYFWLHGDFVKTDDGTDTDLHALKEHWVSVVPMQFDFTAHHAFNHFLEWENLKLSETFQQS